MTRARLFGSLCGLVFFLNLARIVFAPLLDVFIAEFGIGEATAGLIATLVWIGSASLRLPTGWLLTKFSRHRLVVASGLLLAVASAATATAVTPRQLMIGAFAMGIASGVYFVAANPLLSELYPERVGHVLGIHGAATQLAAVVAAPLVTVALLFDWRLSLWTIAVGAAATTVYTWIAARRTEMPRAGREDRAFLAGALSERRVILTALVITGGAVFVWQGIFNFYDLYMQSKGLSREASGAMLTVVFASGVPAFYFGGNLADRLPHVPYLLGIVATFAGCILALTAAEGLFALAVVSAVIGFVVHALFPATDTYVLGALPDSTRASAYAVFSSVWMLTQSVGSSAVGELLEAGYTYNAVFNGAAVCLLASVGLLAAFDRVGGFVE
ncbi:MAG: DHA1 family inner membrane transport protein [Natronomonas sp.]|uniref:MFS transporter n=1 Tax=Natronomonas sp. TaxID=2184060 RepID=UPI0039898BA0